MHSHLQYLRWVLRNPNEVQKARRQSKQNGFSWHQKQKAWQVKFWGGKTKKLHHLGLFRKKAHGAVPYDLVALHLKALRKLEKPYRSTKFLKDLYSEVLASVRQMSLNGR